MKPLLRVSLTTALLISGSLRAHAQASDPTFGQIRPRRQVALAIFHAIPGSPV